MFKLIHRLETDPRWQFNFHGALALFWIACMFVCPLVFLPRYAEAWTALAILEISLWANFATHFGAMSSALAAMGLHEPETPHPFFSEVDWPEELGEPIDPAADLLNDQKYLDEQDRKAEAIGVSLVRDPAGDYYEAGSAADISHLIAK